MPTSSAIPVPIPIPSAVDSFALGHESSAVSRHAAATKALAAVPVRRGGAA